MKLVVILPFLVSDWLGGCSIGEDLGGTSLVGKTSSPSQTGVDNLVLYWFLETTSLLGPLLPTKLNKILVNKHKRNNYILLALLIIYKFIYKLSILL